MTQPDDSADARFSPTISHTPNESAQETLSLKPFTATAFGDYELRSELGRGGMGRVYRARQRNADRFVALKVVRAERLAGLTEDEKGEALARFKAEAKSAARLNHDHIVPIYDVGEFDGCPYYTMRLVEGLSLAHVVAGGPLEPRRAAKYLANVARAVAAAHESGVLHRDLKPHNILLETSTDRALVADFGLAKMIGSSSATLEGEVFGTPSYMAPEQAISTGSVNERADVYSLGATLYHLITGRPPFHAASAPETLRQVIDTLPISPRELNPAIDRDLETICLKCLEKESSRRYASAHELADDLERYLALQPIRARHIGPVGKAWRWARRNRAVAALLVAIVGTSSLGTVVSTDYAIQRDRLATVAAKNAADAQSSATAAKQNESRALKSEAKAVRSAEVAKAREFDARAHQYVSDINLAFAALKDNRFAAVESILKRHIPKNADQDLRSFDWHYLWNQTHRERLRPKGNVKGVFGELAYVDVDSESFQTIDLATKKVRARVRSSIHGAFVMSPDETWLARIERNTAQVWPLPLVDGAKPSASVTFADAPADESRTIPRVELSSAGRRLVIKPTRFAGRPNTPLSVFAVPSLELQHTLSIEGRLLSMSEDADLLAATGLDDPSKEISHSVRLWDLQSGEMRLQIPHPTFVEALDISADGSTVVTGDRFGTVRILVDNEWQVLTTEGVGPVERLQLDAKGSQLLAVTRFSEHRLTTGSLSSTDGFKLSLYDLNTFREIPWPGPTEGVVYAALDVTGKRWLAALPHAVVWGTLDGQGTSGTVPHYLNPAARLVRFSSDGRWLFDQDCVWDASLVNNPMAAKIAPSSISALSFSPAGNQLAVGSVDESDIGSPSAVRLLDLQQPDRTLDLEGFVGTAQNLLFSGDGKQLATVAGNVVLYRAPSGNSGSNRFTIHARGPMRAQVKWINGGKGMAGTFISWDVDQRDIKLWDATTGKCQATLASYRVDNQKDVIDDSVCFSPNSQFVATVIRGNEAALWNSRGDKIWQLPAHSSRILSLAFTPDSNLLALGDANGEIGFYDLARGEKKFQLNDHTHGASSLAFTGANELLVGSGAGLTRHRWGDVVDRHSWTNTSWAGIGQLVLSSRSTLLASSDGNDRQQIWNLDQAKPPVSLEWEGGLFRSMTFTPDRAALAVDCWDDVVRFFDVHTGQVRAEFVPSGDYPPFSMALSPDGRVLAVGCVDGSLYLWTTDAAPASWKHWPKTAIPVRRGGRLLSPEEVVRRDEWLREILQTSMARIRRGELLHDINSKNFANYEGSAFTLERLTLGNATDKDLDYAAGFPGIKFLVVSDLKLPRDVTDKGLRQLKRMTSLEELSIGSFWLNDQDLANLHTLASLKTLKLTTSQVTQSGLDELRKALPDCAIQLTEVRPPRDVVVNKPLSQKPIENNPLPLNLSRGLTWAFERGARVSAYRDGVNMELTSRDQLPTQADGIMIGAVTLPLANDDDMTHLADLSTGSVVCNDCSQLTEVGIAHLQKVPGLRGISFKRVTLTARSIELLAEMPKLQWISLDSPLRWINSETAAVSFAPLSKSSMGVINLENFSQLNPEQLESLWRMPNLVQLNLRRANLSGDGFSQIKLAARLKVLRLAYCQGVTDESLEHLAQAETLNNLSLESTGVSDAGIKHLANCPKLEFLYLRKTKVTAQGLLLLQNVKTLKQVEAGPGIDPNDPLIAQLKKALPGCQFNLVVK